MNKNEIKITEESKQWLDKYYGKDVELLAIEEDTFDCRQCVFGKMRRCSNKCGSEGRDDNTNVYYIIKNQFIGV